MFMSLEDRYGSFSFTKSILKKELNVFNHAEMIRDFTYIDDVVESIMRLLKRPPKSDKSCTSNPILKKLGPIGLILELKPESLIDHIKAIEDNFGLEAKKNYYLSTW